jgi:endonuclease III related protein
MMKFPNPSDDMQNPPCEEPQGGFLVLRISAVHGLMPRSHLRAVAPTLIRAAACSYQTSELKYIMKKGSVVQSRLVRERLEEIYARLYAHFGPQHWWPGDSRWEVMVGAILTQNTSWRNVEQALANLRCAGRLEPAAMRRTRVATLARLIRPSGYFNLKAKKLHALVEFLFARYGGDPAKLVSGAPATFLRQAQDESSGQGLAARRAELLAVYGIGPETADSILLYAAEQPVFVVDAYTRRICARLGLTPAEAAYNELQQLFMRHLPPDVARFNEYHALLVALGKNICLKRAPRCAQCPLDDFCPKIGVN